MKGDKPPNLDRIWAEGTLIDRALRAGVREALLRHKLLGQPVVVWENGRTVRVPPEDIPVGRSRPRRKSQRRRRRSSPRGKG